jgi:glycosyltransferase involved in cell wall biosynthesis
MATTKTNSTPLISIIISYYNQPRLIEETVRSAAAQTYPNIEVIVVDDGSPAPVEPVLRNIHGVSIFRKENAGCPAARNFGFHKSRGEYLIFLDHDDLLRPEAAAVQMKVLNGKGTLSFGAAQLIDEEGSSIASPHLCRPRKDYFLMLLESNPISCVGAAMIRRQAFIDAGLFDESFATIGQSDDYDLYLRLAKLGPLVRHTHCVVDYRQHAHNVSRDKEWMLAGTMHALDKLERDATLNAKQRRRLRHGRLRWIHVFRPRSDLRYRMKTLYFRFRAMLGVPLNELLRLE